MTKLLKAYLTFTIKNKEKLLEATSDYAYEEDVYFECFYDAPRDLIHIHCHGGCEITDTLHTAEELNGYQEKLDDIVEEIEYDKTLMTKESKYNHTLYGEVGKATFYGTSLVKIEGDPADTCGNEGDLYFKIKPTELEYLDFNTPVYALSDDGGKNYDITRKYRLYQLSQNWLHLYGLPVTDANTAKIAKLALENCWGTSIHDFLGDGQDDELFDKLENKYAEIHFSNDLKNPENIKAIIKALKLEADTRYANVIIHWFNQTIEQQVDTYDDPVEIPFKVLGFIQDIVKLIEKDLAKFSNWFNRKDLPEIKKHIDNGTNMMILSHFVIEEAGYWISQNYTISAASLEHFFEDLEEWIEEN